MTDDRLIEADVVDLIRDMEHMFGDIGDSALIFEKAIMQGKTIMDCMICTEKKGVIGIEIKTERDSTQRLSKQLEDYSKVCDYVYVMCHDSHVPKVEKILKAKNFVHVGIIAYVQVKGTAYVGIYEEAWKSPTKDVYHTLNVLWRKDLTTILGTFKHIATRIADANPGTVGMDAPHRSNGFSGYMSQPLLGLNTRKPTLINALISRLGYEEANKVFCDVMINHRNHPDKAIKIEHFNIKGVE